MKTPSRKLWYTAEASLMVLTDEDNLKNKDDLKNEDNLKMKRTSKM